jgi:GTPase SAR1 family protein
MSADFHHAQRQALSLACERLALFIKNLGLPAQHLYEQSQVIRTDRLRILVMGEFKRGKSTLINALLEEDLLPHQATPATPLPIRLTYGEKRTLFLKNQQGEFLEQSFSTLSKLRLRSDDVGQDRFSHWEEALVTLPNAFLLQGIEIIDSPGLHEDALRTARSEGALLKADAIIMVLDATQLLSLSEQAFLEKLKAFGNENLFFVINRYDVFLQSIPVAQQAEQQAQLTERLTIAWQRLWPGQRPRLFYLSALNALKAIKSGKQDNDFSIFLLNLKNFLQQDRLSNRKQRLLGFFQEEQRALLHYWQQLDKLRRLNIHDYLRKEETLRQQIKRLDEQQQSLQSWLIKQQQAWQIWLEQEKNYLENQWLNIVQQIVETGLAEKTFTVKELSEKPLFQLLPDGEQALKKATQTWQEERLEPQLELSRQDLENYLIKEIALYKQTIALDDAAKPSDIAAPLLPENALLRLHTDQLAARHFLYGLPLVSGAGIWLIGLSSFSLPAALALALVGFFVERQLRWQRIQKELRDWLKPLLAEIAANFIHDHEVYVQEKLKRWQSPFMELLQQLSQESARLQQLLTTIQEQRQYNQQQSNEALQKRQLQKAEAKALFQAIFDLLQDWHTRAAIKKETQAEDVIKWFSREWPRLSPQLPATLRSQAQALQQQILDWQHQPAPSWWCCGSAGSGKTSIVQFLLGQPLFPPRALGNFDGLLHFSPGETWQLSVFLQENLIYQQEIIPENALSVLLNILAKNQDHASCRCQFTVPDLAYQLYDCPAFFNAEHPLWPYFQRQSWRARIIYSVDSVNYQQLSTFRQHIRKENNSLPWTWWSSEQLSIAVEEKLSQILVDQEVFAEMQVVLSPTLALLQQALKVKSYVSWQVLLAEPPLLRLLLPAWGNFFWPFWLKQRLQPLGSREILEKWQQKVANYQSADRDRLEKTVSSFTNALNPLLKELATGEQLGQSRLPS